MGELDSVSSGSSQQTPLSVKVFSSNLEPYSEMLMNLLKYHHIQFENIDVTNKPDRLVELINVSGQATTPVVVVGERVYIGFDRALIKHVLGLQDT